MNDSSKMRQARDDGLGVMQTGFADSELCELDDRTLRRRIASLARFPDENPNPVMRVSGDGTVLYANRASVLLLAIRDCFSANGTIAGSYRELTRKALDTGMCLRGSVECGSVTYDLAFAPVIESGYVNIYGHDVTHSMLVEKQLEAAKEQAEAANRAKSNFLASVSHEVRTPLGSILGFTRLMMDNHELSDQNRAYMETIKRNGDHLLALLDDLLDLSKIEAGQFEVHPEKIALVDEVGVAVSVVMPKIKTRNLAFEVRYLGPLPESIVTDKRRLNQILINLLTNAAKFTDDGFIRLSVRLDQSPFDDYPARLEFIVEDSGIGIDAESCEILFKPFARGLHGDAGRGRKGTGLGLALSRNLARKLGGDLRLVRSAPGRGSAFRLTIETGSLDGVALKRYDMENNGLQAQGRVSTWLGRVAGRLEGATILVADDAIDMQALIGIYLEKAGAKVRFCGNGAEALQVAATEFVDLILMDIEMPRMNGHEATSKLRANGFPKPIVALTAHALKEERHRCLACGCDDYLSKPVHPVRLVETVERYLGRVPPA